MTETTKNWLAAMFKKEINEVVASIKNHTTILAGIETNTEEFECETSTLIDLNNYLMTLKDLVSDLNLESFIK